MMAVAGLPATERGASDGAEHTARDYGGYPRRGVTARQTAREAFQVRGSRPSAWRDACRGLVAACVAGSRVGRLRRDDGKGQSGEKVLKMRKANGPACEAEASG